MIINRIYETQNILSLQLVSFVVGLRTYQHISFVIAKECIYCAVRMVDYLNVMQIKFSPQNLQSAGTPFEYRVEGAAIETSWIF
jgi:hypothetical protein